MYLNKAKEIYQQLRLSPAYPCTQEEIAKVEQALGLQLPSAFAEYLLWMGHGAAGMMQGSDFFYLRLFDLKEGVDDIFERNPDHPPLPQDAIVFFMHAGSHFMFICASEGDNPPVYFYDEGMTQFQQIAPSFSQYLETQIREHAKFLEEKKTWKEPWRSL